MSATENSDTSTTLDNPSAATIQRASSQRQTDRYQRDRRGDRRSIYHQQQHQNEADGCRGDRQHLPIDRGEFVDDRGTGARDVDVQTRRW